VAVSEAEAHPIADPRRRKRASEYARIRRRLFVVDLVLSAVLLALLVVSGASIWLRTQVAALTAAYFGQVALYVVALTLGYAVLFLPLAYYSGFVLPHRYDLSVQTRRGWLADYGKGTLIGLVQAVVLAVAVYALLRYFPATWWLWAALVILLFAVLLANLAPVLIVPLFYKQRPLADDDLRRRLLALAGRAGTRVRGVFVLDLSRRTKTTNAALMGIGNTRRIVLGDTMWERFQPAEIEAVLAHELGHHVHHDLWRGIGLETILTFGALWAADQALRALVPPLGLTGIDDLAGLPVLLLVAGALFTVLLPVTNGFARRWEGAADRFAVEITRNVDAWKGALAKLADQNLAEVDPPAWVEWLLYSHPSIRHRLEAADAAATRLAPPTRDVAPSTTGGGPRWRGGSASPPGRGRAQRG
jgi:STE24 endopeptidase